MLVPEYVHNYWRAQLWEFLYFGIPALAFSSLVGLIILWREHKDDMHANDEPNPSDMPAGKTLNL